MPQVEAPWAFQPLTNAATPYVLARGVSSLAQRYRALHDHRVVAEPSVLMPETPLKAHDPLEVGSLLSRFIEKENRHVYISLK